MGRNSDASSAKPSHGSTDSSTSKWCWFSTCVLCAHGILSLIITFPHILPIHQRSNKPQIPAEVLTSFTYLLELWEDFRYFAEIIFKDRMASTAASSTSALFLIRPKKGRRRNQLKLKLQHEICFPKYNFGQNVWQAAVSRSCKTYFSSASFSKSFSYRQCS